MKSINFSFIRFKKNKLIPLVCVLIFALYSTASYATVYAKTTESKDKGTVTVFTPTATTYYPGSFPSSLNNTDIFTEVTITPNLKSSAFSGIYNNPNGYVLSESGKLLLHDFGNGEIGYCIVFPFDVWEKDTHHFYPAGATIRWSKSDIVGNSLKAKTFIFTPASQNQMALNGKSSKILTVTVNAGNADNKLTSHYIVPFKSNEPTVWQSWLLPSLSLKTPGKNANLQSGKMRYTAYDEVTINTQPAISGLTVGGDPVNLSSGTNRSGCVWMGEDVDFYIDTVGNFGNSGSYIEITPTYKVVDAAGREQNFELYTNIQYDLMTGYQQHAVKLSEHSLYDNVSNGGHSPIEYSVTYDLDAKPSVREISLTQALLGTNTFSSTRWYDKIILDDGAKLICDSKELFDRYPFLEDSIKTDVNNDHCDDEVQKTFVRWYGAISIPQDTLLIPKDLYCARCGCGRAVFYHAGEVGRCPACGNTNLTGMLFDINPGTRATLEEYLFDGSLERYMDDNHLTDGLFIEITLDAKIVDCAGNITNINNLELKDKDRGSFVLKYKMGTKASDKWQIVY